VPREYVDLTEVISFSEFSFERYREGERNILTPQLKALGYTEVEFLPGETDSFGPLSRTCRATDSQGYIVWFMYG
jgi:hypothetical protein